MADRRIDPNAFYWLFYIEGPCDFCANLRFFQLFLARDTIIPSDLPGMALWRERLFAWMMQNAATPSDFFKIPPNRVVELGTKIEI
jgi:KUP system potassium uptake protein